MQSLVRNFEWCLDSSFGEIEDRCKVLFEPHPNGHATSYWKGSCKSFSGTYTPPEL